MNNYFCQVKSSSIWYWLIVFMFLIITIPAISADNPGTLNELKTAFNSRDIAAASRILGGNIDISQEFDWPLIVVTANHRQLGLMQEVINSGADLNDTNTHGDTALILAAYNNYPEVVRLLASHGANLNARGHDGATALIWAVKKGYMEISEILLSHGANANLGIQPGYRHQFSARFGTPYPGNVGSTALILATEKGDLPMVNALLKAGADVNATDADCQSALDAAKQRQIENIADVLVKHGALLEPRCQHAERQQEIVLQVLAVFIGLLLWEIYWRKPAAGARVLGYLVNLPVALLIFESGDSVEPLSIVVPLANVLVLFFHGFTGLTKAAIIMNMIAMAVGVMSVFADYNTSNPLLIFFVIEAFLIAGIQLVNIRILRAQLNKDQIDSISVSESQ